MVSHLVGSLTQTVAVMKRSINDDRSSIAKKTKLSIDDEVSTNDAAPRLHFKLDHDDHDDHSNV